MDAAEDEAFVAFVAGAQRELGHLAWLLTGDRHRAEELVQDTVARTYAAWHRIRHQDPLVYARRVLVNARTDTWRRRRREHLVPDVTAVAASTDVERRGATPDLAVLAAQRDEIVAALRTLAPRERAVLVLRYYADLSEAQTATELRVSLGTVKSTASRALARLRATAVDEHLTVQPGSTR